MAGMRPNQWQTYNNLKELCIFRGAKVVDALQDEKYFTAKMEADQHATILAERPATDPRGAATIMIAQLSSSRTFEETTSKFTTLIDKLLKNAPQSFFNLIFVPVDVPSNSMLDIIATRNSPTRLIECHRARLFSIIVPRNISVPQHSIASPEEIAFINKKMFVTSSSFPRIIASGEKPDPVAIWMGFRPGMIIRVDRFCETSGCEIAYRLCI